MTSQPSPAPGEGRTPDEYLRPLRDLAAWALVGAPAVLLFVAVIRLIPAGDGEQFASRAQDSFYAFVNLPTLLFPLGAVLLALVVQPRHPKAKLITVLAAVEYAVAAFFAVVFGILVALIQIAGFSVRAAFEELLVRAAWLAVFGLAAFAVYRIWRGMFYVPKPKPQPGVYGQPQYGVPGAYPGQPGYGPPPPGYGQPGQPSWNQQAYAQPGYPPAGGTPGWGQPPGTQPVNPQPPAETQPVNPRPVSTPPAPSSGAPGWGPPAAAAPSSGAPFWDPSGSAAPASAAPASGGPLHGGPTPPLHGAPTPPLHGAPTPPLQGAPSQPPPGVPAPPPAGPFAPGQAPAYPPGSYGNPAGQPPFRAFADPTQAVPRHEQAPTGRPDDRTEVVRDERRGFGPADDDPPRR